jgi:hypothetical protein
LVWNVVRFIASPFYELGRVVIAGLSVILKTARAILMFSAFLVVLIVGALFPIVAILMTPYYAYKVISQHTSTMDILKKEVEQL